MACLWLFKSKDGTKLGGVINTAWIENRLVAYRYIITLDKKKNVSGKTDLQIRTNSLREN